MHLTHLPPCHPATLPPCHPATHSRTVLPSPDTFFTVDASHEPGMACVEVTHTRAHARAPSRPIIHSYLPELASSSRRTTVSCSGFVCDARSLPDDGYNTRQHQQLLRFAPSISHHGYRR